MREEGDDEDAVALNVPPPSGSHTRLWLGLGGLLASILVLIGGGQVGPVAGATYPSSWLWILARDHVDPSHTPLPGIILVCGIAALVGVWLLTLRHAIDQNWSLRELWRTAICWCAPLALGPPLLSADVYSYAAQGLLASNGSDPYSTTPSQGLAPTIIAGIDPVWRSAFSPYGPLATFTEHLAVIAGGGTVLGAVIMLRLLAIAAVAAIGLLATALTSPRRRPIVLLLSAANPLVLLHFGSAAHIDALVTVLVLAALLAERRGKLELAVALGCAAGMVKAPGFLVVAVIAVTCWHNVALHRRETFVRLGGVLLASFGVLTLLVPHGWGWVSSLTTPGHGDTPAAPAVLLGWLFRPLVGVASYDDLMAAGRITMLIAGGAAILAVLATSRQRTVPSSTGWCLLIFAAVSPVLYPWYLGAAVVVLAIDARGHRRDWLIALSVWGITLSIPGVVVWFAVLVVVPIDVGILLWLIWALRGRPSLRRTSLRGAPA